MADNILAIEHIVSTPDIMGGKPRIAGQRVSVENIVVLHEMHNWTAEQIAGELDLTLAQVHAALAYYYDHKQELDRSIQEGEATVKAAGVSADALKRIVEARRSQNK